MGLQIGNVERASDWCANEGKGGTAALASAGRNVASAPFTCRQRAAAGAPSALLSCRSQAGDVFAGRRARPFQAGARRGGRAAEVGGEQPGHRGLNYRGRAGTTLWKLCATDRWHRRGRSSRWRVPLHGSIPKVGDFLFHLQKSQ